MLKFIMCGIVGFTGKTNSEILEKMTDSIIHRGPNDSAYIVNSSFSVGFRRLSIIDLSQNIYPIRNEDNSIELFLNGEIYNFQLLKKELTKLGHVFKTKSDSEVIVHGYEEWGYSVVDKLRGMFVFALLDKAKNCLFICRDRLGIKPFYYSKINDQLIFGSEIKSILNNFDISREPNEESVYKFLAYRIHDTNEDTFFKNVKRLMPGHYMIIRSDSSFEIQKYWNPKFNSDFSSKKPDKEYSEEFKEIFQNALDLHLISDVPVGVTLSGGLDSSGITTLSKELYDQKYPNFDREIIAFSAVHPGETIDESEYIDEIVAQTKIKSIKIQPDVDKFWDDFNTWIKFQEEPVISGAPYAYYSVMREASKNVTVLLSGQGGDELLAGYIPYFLNYLKTAWDKKKFWPIIREAWLGKDLYFPFFLKKLFQERSRKTTLSVFAMLNSEFKKNKNTFKPSRNLNERLFNDVLRDTTPSLLRYEDKNSMANSLESRVPFFDHKVVEYIFNLPIDQKIKFGWNRYIYRNMMKGIIPEKNRLRRSKVGFTNPEWEWIEKKDENFKKVFSSDSFKSRKFWDAEKISKEFIQAIQGNRAGDFLIFWRFFITEMWMREYVD